jgi:MoxR-like ATPase
MDLMRPTKPQRTVGQQIYDRLFENIQRVVKGQDGAIRKLLAAFFSGGHVLLEEGRERQR